MKRAIGAVFLALAAVWAVLTFAGVAIDVVRGFSERGIGGGCAAMIAVPLRLPLALIPGMIAGAIGVALRREE